MYPTIEIKKKEIFYKNNIIKQHSPIPISNDNTNP